MTDISRPLLLLKLLSLFFRRTSRDAALEYDRTRDSGSSKTNNKTKYARLKIDALPDFTANSVGGG